jgi:DNA-binding CsgD family transcriptional regulator
VVARSVKYVAPDAACLQRPALPLPPVTVDAPGVDLLTIMSDREREIALLVTAGLSNKEIAQNLTISHWTVSTHLRRIFAKLDICRRVELCAIVSTSRRGAIAGR